MEMNRLKICSLLAFVYMRRMLPRVGFLITCMTFVMIDGFAQYMKISTWRMCGVLGIFQYACILILDWALTPYCAIANARTARRWVPQSRRLVMILIDFSIAKPYIFLFSQFICFCNMHIDFRVQDVGRLALMLLCLNNASGYIHKQCLLTDLRLCHGVDYFWWGS